MVNVVYLNFPGEKKINKIKIFKKKISNKEKIEFINLLPIKNRLNSFFWLFLWHKIFKKCVNKSSLHVNEFLKQTKNNN